MKTKMLILISTGCLLLVAGCGQEQPVCSVYKNSAEIIAQAIYANTNQVGRYQLLSAKVLQPFGLMSAQPHADEMLFKIDTVSGKVWKYHIGSIPIDENSSEAIEAWWAIRDDWTAACREAAEDAAAARKAGKKEAK